MGWGKVLEYMLGGFDKLTHWVKRSKRRKDVQTMDEAVDANDSATVSNKLSELKRKEKNRRDSE